MKAAGWVSDCKMKVQWGKAWRHVSGIDSGLVSGSSISSRIWLSGGDSF